jgi:VIT1/CCC1 family predicted Fe2+/Mn2+ transporter
VSDAATKRKGVTRAVIFGLADGAMSILGVVFYLSGHSGLVFPAALSGGLSAAASMAGGEWLSESDHGLAASAAMGAATLTGSVLPAIPYAFLSGWRAPAVSVLTLMAVAAVVARLRTHRTHPYLETALVLGVVLTVAVTCGLLVPGGGA